MGETDWVSCSTLCHPNRPPSVEVMEMSIKAISWALSQTTGSPTSKLVLIKLADNANDEGMCYPSYQLISQHTELSKRSIMDHIKKLADAGFLRIENRFVDGAQITNKYFLNLSKTNSPPVNVVHGGSERGAGGVVNVAHDGSERGAWGVVNDVHSEPSIRTVNEPSIRTVNKPSASAVVLPDVIDSKIWESFVEHRKTIKKPMSKNAQELMIKKLMSFNAKGHDVNAIIETSVMNGWAGVFEPNSAKKRGVDDSRPDFEAWGKRSRKDVDLINVEVVR